MPDIHGYRHGSSRSNPPTDQTEPFMDDADKRPERYEPPLRDRSGPALSWDRGENLDDLAGDATPLYISEKIHPSAFVAQLHSLDPAPLFGDFNNLPADAAYEWYQHEGNWSNRLIRGDSVRVMASLLKKEGMEGKVQMIYMDPPYGIGFKSNLQVATDDRNTPANKNALPADPTVVQTFRDTYENGVHSYLDNLYRNFVYSHALLAESGSIFVQIGSENVNRVALVLDEVFGAENRVAQIVFTKIGGRTSEQLPEVADHLLWYAKSLHDLTYHQLYEKLSRREVLELMSSYAMVELHDGTMRRLSSEERSDVAHLPDGARLFRIVPLISQHESATGRSSPYTWRDKSYSPPPDSQWRVSKEGMDRIAETGRMIASAGGHLSWKQYEGEIAGRRINNIWASPMHAPDRHYVVETSTTAIERCILMSTNPGDLVMDITCGGGTTAYVAEQWGRRWITADTSGVALAITRQRLLAATYDWYHLQDSAAGAAEEARLSGRPADQDARGEGSRDPAKGFVYERVPRVSAAILAYDQDADPILLVNRPLVKSGVVRVSSPFTVESHAPWRYVAPHDPPDLAADQIDTRQRMIDAITKTGIETGVAGLKLKIEDVEDWGEQARATHTCVSVDAEGTRTATALAVVPDDQSASSSFVNVAAQEAAARGLKRLIVVAFAYDASTRTSMEQRGQLQIIKAEANRDFQIPGLETQPSDNAFVMLGEPEIATHDESDDKISVEVRGYLSYNPATGEVEHKAADDVNCWMIDTEYNGEAFFARRIHLPNSSGDKRINRLRNRLGKRVDPVLWDSMQSMRSAPFPRPTGEHVRIAVRIITRTGIEMTIERDV